MRGFTPLLAVFISAPLLAQDAAPANTLTEEEFRSGWSLLFDGSSAKGWRGYRRDAFPDQGWIVEDGTLRVAAGGGGGDIVTRRKYRNFELALEFKLSPGANSGIMYRAGEGHPASWQSAPEYQVLDDGGYAVAADSLTSVGALYDLYAPAGKKTRPVGEWNQARIVVDADLVEHWLNGVRVVSCKLGSEDWKERVGRSKFNEYEDFGGLARGHIVLQDHGNDVWYRNIKVRELAPKSGELVRLFNGQDLSGWTAFTQDGTPMEEVWSVRDGVLHCKGTPAGYIMTEASYTSFALRVEWRWPGEPGNSGVLVRKTGEDKIWPRSCEAQLMNGRAGDFWQIGEFPMTTDPERVNGRNTRAIAYHEKPVGEWNTYVILVDGDDVVLEVNGAILNEAVACEVVAGRICLQSEGAPIEFRNILLVELDE